MPDDVVDGCVMADAQASTNCLLEFTVYGADLLANSHDGDKGVHLISA
jgi:hypothetical protein